MILAEVWTTQRISFKVHTVANNHSQQVKYSITAATAAAATAYSLPVTFSQDAIEGRGGGGVVGVGDGDGDENLIELVEVTSAE